MLNPLVRRFTLALVLVYTGLSVAKSAEVPANVVIVDSDTGYSLRVNSQPYEVKGVGMGYSQQKDLAMFAAAGGNTFRTWESDLLDQQLEAARELGLMVLVGLDTGKQLTGFDYSDQSAVDAQHERLVEFVEGYKNHPNVLGWILANEPNLLFDNSGAPVPADPAVYDALARLTDYIHETDPHHPVTISFSFTPSLAQDIDDALSRIPELDFVSLQAYGALSVIPDLVNDIALKKPFMITEYGPLGHWEMPTSDWGREVEEPSGPKASGFIERMQPVVMNDTTGKLLGAFAFLWGQKQERTPTWYGMFIESGEKTAIVDELTQLWTGSYPDNRAPSSESITLADQSAYESVRLKPGIAVTARLAVTDYENDVLHTHWQLMEEVKERSDGGHFEATPPIVALQPVATSEALKGAVNGLVTGHGADGMTTLEFVTPDEPGEYRLYAYTRDGQGGAGTANLPFLVEAE